MTPEEYREQLGGIVGNFHALEFLLRGFLQSLPAARPIGIPHGTDIYSFPVGTKLPENELTSYDSLGLLITKFNNEMAKRGLPQIDSTLVEIRDAVAHGRVSAHTKQGYLRLLKFDKPENRRVCVTFNEELTEAWFTKHTRRIFAAIESVARQAGAKIEP